MVKYKTFGELKAGDPIYKIHIEFDKDNYYVEEKIISEIQQQKYPGNFHKGDLYFKFNTDDNMLFDWCSFCELISDKTYQMYEEIHQLYTTSHEPIDAECVYYATSEEQANKILKDRAKLYVYSLIYQRNKIVEEIEKFEKFYKS